MDKPTDWEAVEKAEASGQKIQEYFKAPDPAEVDILKEAPSAETEKKALRFAEVTAEIKALEDERANLRAALIEAVGKVPGCFKVGGCFVKVTARAGAVKVDWKGYTADLEAFILDEMGEDTVKKLQADLKAKHLEAGKGSTAIEVISPSL